MIPQSPIFPPRRQGFSPLFLRVALLLGLLFAPFRLSSASGFRIVSLVPSQTEILFELGLGPEIVGVSEYCNFPPEAASLPKVGGIEINLEKLVSLNPTTIVDLNGMHRRYELFFAQIGVKYLDVSIKKLREIPTGAQRMADYFGRGPLGAKFVESWNKRFEQETLPLPNSPKVYVEIWDTPMQGAGPASFLGEIIEAAGGRNVLRHDVSPFPVVNGEQIVQANPDVIIVSYPLDDLNRIRKRAGWSEISAIRRDRLFALEVDTLVRPGPRCLDAVKTLRTLFQSLK
jgi:iron complex transport system substrate-binding protein